jgi:hypothetical protein
MLLPDVESLFTSDPRLRLIEEVFMLGQTRGRRFELGRCSYAKPYLASVLIFEDIASAKHCDPWEAAQNPLAQPSS